MENILNALVVLDYISLGQLSSSVYYCFCHYFTKLKVSSNTFGLSLPIYGNLL